MTLTVRQAVRSLAYNPQSRSKTSNILVLSSTIFCFTLLSFYVIAPLELFRWSFLDREDVTNMQGAIDIAIKLRGLKEHRSRYTETVNTFRTLVKSLYANASRRPLHLILLTDSASLLTAANVLTYEKIPFYHNGRLVTPPGKKKQRTMDRMPVYVDFVDIDSIREYVETPAWAMKSFFNHHDESMFLIHEGNNATDDKIEIRTGDRFNDNMYYLAPFYHDIFPEMDKLIMLDSDLEFKVDPAKLYDEFSHFSEDQLIGIANDLSPHYYQMLSNYRGDNQDTLVGMPGRFQGLNTGVMLLNLERMRKSSQYKYYLGWDGIAELAETYRFDLGHIGDQDWLTLFGMAAPDLIYPLPCLFNRQINEEYNAGIWKDIFKFFYACENITESGVPAVEAYILHGNSGESIVRYNALQEAQQRLRRKHIYNSGKEAGQQVPTNGSKSSEWRSDNMNEKVKESQ